MLEATETMAKLWLERWWWLSSAVYLLLLSLLLLCPPSAGFILTDFWVVLFLQERRQWFFLWFSLLFSVFWVVLHWFSFFSCRDEDNGKADLWLSSAFLSFSVYIYFLGLCSVSFLWFALFLGFLSGFSFSSAPPYFHLSPLGSWPVRPSLFFGFYLSFLRPLLWVFLPLL